MGDADDIGAFHASARRRRRVVWVIASIVLVGLAVFALWLSATTPKSKTYTRGNDLDPVPPTILVALVVAVGLGAVVYRLRKDSR